MKYLSRKFALAFLFTVTGCVGFLFKGLLTGSEFLGLVTAIMGVFTVGDTALNWIHRDKKNPDAPTRSDQ